MSQKRTDPFATDDGGIWKVMAITFGLLLAARLALAFYGPAETGSNSPAADATIQSAATTWNRPDRPTQSQPSPMGLADDQPVSSRQTRQYPVSAAEHMQRALDVIRSSRRASPQPFSVPANDSGEHQLAYSNSMCVRFQQETPQYLACRDNVFQHLQEACRELHYERQLLPHGRGPADSAAVCYAADNFRIIE